MSTRHSPPLPRSRWPQLLGFVALSAAIYARHLGDGPVADDFLYLSWLDTGPAELLHRLTLGSEPQMLRPLAALGWMLTELPGQMVWLRLLAVLLHALVGVLVAAVGRTLGASEPAAVVAGCLFVAFPLLSEPVLWASAFPDLLAAVLGLSAALVALTTPHRWFLATVLLLAALAAKESAAALPLALLALGGWQRLRRPLVAMAVTVATVGLLRYTIFGGLGGYADASGERRPLAIDLGQLLHRTLLQTPRRLLGLLRSSESAHPVMFPVFHALLLALVAQRSIPLGKLGQVGRALVAGLLALLPAAAVFGIDSNLQGARLLYLPLAIVCAGVAPALDTTRRGALAGLCLLLTGWGVGAIANATAWRTAARLVERTLAEVVQVSSGLPENAVLYVDAPESLHGAFALRNGLVAGARLAGVRRDVRLILGQPSQLGYRRALGVSAFATRSDEGGSLVDWTECARALLVGKPEVLASIPVQGGLVDLPTGAFALQVVLHRAPVEPVWVDLYPGSAEGTSIEGRVFPGRHTTVVVLGHPLPAPLRHRLRVGAGASPAANAAVAVEVLNTPTMCFELASLRDRHLSQGADSRNSARSLQDIPKKRAD